MFADFTTTQLRAIRFALHFTYWLHKATMFADCDWENLCNRMDKVIERRRGDEI